MEQGLYDDAFFASQEEGARRSGDVVAPYLVELLRPQSVIDVGCGLGGWLAAFAATGVRDYLGVDGDYVCTDRLSIDPQRFLRHDLRLPFRLDRTFDLALCLEVAEHLPAHCAGQLVASLTQLAPAVLFSAAVPGQIGVGHINEQWPDYWHRLFEQRNYVGIDAVRGEFWNDQRVDGWYRQNILLFVERERLSDYPPLRRFFDKTGPRPVLSLVHPEHYLSMQRAMFSYLIAAPHHMMLYFLRMRLVNLLVHPDWTQPEATLAEQLGELLAAAWTHPQRKDMALVFHLPQGRESWARQTIERAVAVGQALGVEPCAEGPELVVVGCDLSPKHLELLVECCAGRVQLARENPASVAAIGSGGLSGIPVSALRSGQGLVPAAAIDALDS